MANEVRKFAERLYAVERRVRSIGSGAQLAYSSLEDGAISAFNQDGAQTGTIGRQWDGTYTATFANGPIPPTPTSAIVTDGVQAISVRCDGSFEGGAFLPMDFLRFDFHIGTVSGFTPSHENRYGTFTAPTGGEVSIALPTGIYYVKLVCWTVAGSVSLPSTVVEVESLPIEVTTDGLAPASSPAVELIGGLDIMLARWTAISNADPVKYDVHISDTTGFTPDSTTLVGTTESTAYTIKQLPGTPPADPSAPDPRKLQYGIDYFVKIVARDADGSATAGAEDSAQIFQVTGVNLSADSVTAANVVAGTLTGDLFSASVVIAGAFRTAETGQRVEMTPLGLFAYRSDGSIMLSIPTDSPDALFDGEFVVRGATILGGMSIQSLENELTADAALTLMRGIAAPSASPQLQVYYDTIQFSTASLSAAQKTNNDPSWGLGGPFDFAASQCSSIEWRPSFGGHFVCTQVRGNGSRTWFFDNTGAPKSLGGIYYSDFKDWEIWSTSEMTTSSTPSKNGVYALFRFLAGAGTDYWLSSPVGMNKVVRQNTSAVPVIGNNGQDMFIAEVITGGKLSIRYFLPNGSGGNLPAPGTTYESASGYSTTRPLATVTWNAAGFDRGSGRYLVGERATTLPARLIAVSGTGAGSLLPGGAASWVAADVEEESFESPATRRCMCWDGVNFWTMGSDGFAYKHTGEQWDKNAAGQSSLWWAKLAFSDTDAGGTGTHTTAAGTAKSFTANRRASMRWVPPPVPDNGGVDDPNTCDLYMARGATLPANSSFHLQTSGIAPTTFTTLATVTATPPTVSTFPNTNPAMIRNDDDTLRIDATGLIRAGAGKLYAGSIQVVEDPPYWYGYLPTEISIANATYAVITVWSADTAAGHGVYGNTDAITAASGVYTINKAGTYRVAGQVTWKFNEGSTGRRIFQSTVGAGFTVIQSAEIQPYTGGQPIVQLDKEYRFNVGDTIRFRVYQNVTPSAVQKVSPGVENSWIQIRYVGP